MEVKTESFCINDFFYQLLFIQQAVYLILLINMDVNNFID